MAPIKKKEARVGRKSQVTASKGKTRGRGRAKASTSGTAKKRTRRTATKRKRVTPKYGNTRGPHPPSPGPELMRAVVATLPRHGHIARNPTGLIYVDLDDAWVFTPLRELEKYGYEAPPYFYPPLATGAHITLIPANIAKKYQVDPAAVNVGERVEFQMSRCQVVYPNRYWYGTEAVYQYKIKSAKLTNLRRRLLGGKWKRPPPLNIAVAVRQMKVKEESKEVGEKSDKKQIKKEIKEEEEDATGQQVDKEKTKEEQKIKEEKKEVKEEQKIKEEKKVVKEEQKIKEEKKEVKEEQMEQIEDSQSTSASQTFDEPRRNTTEME